MKIAVLFDGAGLARLGLEQAGHECTGFEIDPAKHHLSKFVGSGNSVLMDATQVDLTKFDAVWASPPCQRFSSARTQGEPESQFSDDLLGWSLAIPNDVLWVENVVPFDWRDDWGKRYNAAQFLEIPIQNRNRMIGGRYKEPRTFRPHKKFYREFNICPSILATEHKGSAKDKRRASRFYGRMLTPEECAYHQGFEIPKEWFNVPTDYGYYEWKLNIYEAIGNGVPVYMSKTFGEAYK